MTDNIAKLDNKALRKFGLLIGAIIAVLFGSLIPWLGGFSLPLWSCYLAGALWFSAFVFPAALKPIYKVWMLLGMTMGWINTRIVLGVLFYLVFTPISLALKIVNKDPMQRNMNLNAESYRSFSKNPSREKMEKPF